MDEESQKRIDEALEDLRQKIGVEIKARIKKKELTLYRVTVDTGLGLQLVKRILNGERVVADNLFILASYLKMTITIGPIKAPRLV